VNIGIMYTALKRQYLIRVPTGVFFTIKHVRLAKLLLITIQN